MTLKQIRTTNIQSHKAIVLDLPEKGLIRLQGPNSAGKSVPLKVLVYTLEKQIAHPKVRAALVSRDSTFGEVTFVRSDDCELTIHLTVNAATTYVSLKEKDKEAVVRYLADKNYRDLVTEFGFHYNDDRNFSINIGEGDKSILFYTTGSRTNYEAVDIALSDAYASQALDNMENTVKTARDFRDKAMASIAIIDSALSELKTYDVELLSAKLERLERCFNILSAIYIPKIPDIKAVPRVHTVSVYEPTLPTVKWPRVVDLQFSIPDIIPVQREIATLRSNVCPTCGRTFEC